MDPPPHGAPTSFVSSFFRNRVIYFIHNFGDYSSYYKDTFERYNNYNLVFVKTSQSSSPPATGAGNLRPATSPAKK
jgi:hypothetical protein